MRHEVEQKFPLSERAALEAKLVDVSARPTGSCQQVDHYFNHPCRDFATTDEAVRIRSVGDQTFITYKGPKRDAATKTRREIELPLAAGASAARDFTELLEVLGFRSVAVVRKERRTFDVSWQGRDFEVALDEVAELGSFAELEVVVEDADVTAAQASLLALAKRLELSHSERRSYLELLLAKRH